MCFCANNDWIRNYETGMIKLLKSIFVYLNFLLCTVKYIKIEFIGAMGCKVVLSQMTPNHDFLNLIAIDLNDRIRYTLKVGLTHSILLSYIIYSNVKINHLIY